MSTDVSTTEPVAGSIRRQPRWTTKRAIITVAIVGLSLRLWSVGSLPLIITNDGQTYLVWGENISKGVDVTIPPFRTPGYPFFVAGVFKIFGMGPVGVQLVQHLLGCVTCVCVALVACRLGGAVLGTIAGLLCCLDPVLLAYESYALSGTLTTCLVTASACLAICCRRPRIWVAVVMGVLLAMACLVRPSSMVFIPFVLAGYWLGSYAGRGKLVLVAVVSVVGLGGMLAPWLIHNARRGIYGLASGSGGQFWYGLARFHLIDADSALDPEIGKAFKAIPHGPKWNPTCHDFMRNLDGMGSRSAFMKEWSLASIRKNRWEYLRIAAYAFGWQVRYFPASGPCSGDELNWYMRRRGADGSNFQMTGKSECIEKYGQDGQGGPLRRFYLWYARTNIPGIPQIPLLVGALLIIILSLFRRDWSTALVLLGTMAFLAAHAVLLASNQRYMMVGSTLWYAMVAAVPWAIIQGIRRLLGSDTGDSDTIDVQET